MEHLARIAAVDLGRCISILGFRRVGGAHFIELLVVARISEVHELSHLLLLFLLLPAHDRGH